MDDYISREAAVRYLKGYSEKELNGKGSFGMITSSVLNKVARAISEMPAADVQPVKHGRWEYDHTIGGMKRYHCTNCKCIADENEILWWEFCPRCGCKLDFGDDNDD